MRLIILIAFLTASLSAQLSDSDIKHAIVKIYTSSKKPSYKKPWLSTTSRSSGSGAYIGDNHILTNAHVIANSTYIEVQKYGSAKRYIAKVVAVSHQLDLALLSVKEKKFFNNIKPLSIGTLPFSEEKILVYGYPMGGKTLSVTSGVVSRIEHQSYVHSNEKFLSLQVDAAINPGNSGGPAINKGKIVGVVMQGITLSQNIGYLVPTVMIKHFLKDWEDGRIDGVPSLQILTTKLEDPVTKEYYGLKESQSGIFVSKVMPLGNSNGILKENDIILSIDNVKIEGDGTISFRKYEYTAAKYLTDLHQFGETVTLKVLRNKKMIDLKVKLKVPDSRVWLVKSYQYDKDPRYFIYGGYIFSPLIENLISTGKHKDCRFITLLQKFATKEKREQVVLLDVLPDSSNRGNQNIYNYLPTELNGKKIQDFNDFYSRIRSIKSGFITLKDANNRQLILNVERVLKSQNRILKTYNIQYDRSADLRKKQ